MIQKEEKSCSVNKVLLERPVGVHDCLAQGTLVPDALQAPHEEGDETAASNAAKVGKVTWIKQNKMY